MSDGRRSAILWGWLTCYAGAELTAWPVSFGRFALHTLFVTATAWIIGLASAKDET